MTGWHVFPDVRQCARTCLIWGSFRFKIHDPQGPTYLLLTLDRFHPCLIMELLGPCFLTTIVLSSLSMLQHCAIAASCLCHSLLRLLAIFWVCLWPANIGLHVQKSREVSELSAPLRIHILVKVSWMSSWASMWGVQLLDASGLAFFYGLYSGLEQVHGDARSKSCLSMLSSLGSIDIWVSKSKGSACAAMVSLLQSNNLLKNLTLTCYSSLLFHSTRALNSYRSWHRSCQHLASIASSMRVGDPSMVWYLWPTALSLD